MAKVIVERPRFVDFHIRRPRREAIDEAPMKVSMRERARTSGAAKYFSDNLKPLIRYIDKQVGRSWNRVFSEITADLNVNSPLHHHLRTHVKELVDTDPCTAGLPWRYQPFQVDDRGILRRAPGQAKGVAPQQPVARAQELRVGAREFKLVNGLWFEVILDDPSGRHADLTMDRGLSEETWKDWRRNAGPRMRQLSRRELRQMGLRNDAA